MTTAELIALASPPCHECGLPVQRVEQSWRQGEDGWVLAALTMVCREGHRVPVEQ